MSRYLEKPAPIEELAISLAIKCMKEIKGMPLNAAELALRVRLDIALAAGSKSVNPRHAGDVIDEFIDYGHRYRGLVILEAMFGETIHYGADTEEMRAVRNTFRNRLARAVMGDERAIKWLYKYQQSLVTIDSDPYKTTTE